MNFKWANLKRKRISRAISISVTGPAGFCNLYLLGEKEVKPLSSWSGIG
jgi:hypothetical protein